MLTEITVRDYVAKLGSGEATPGGGSAAALVGALAAALGEMVANFTREKPGWVQIESVLLELTAHRQALLDLTDRDAEAYAGVRAAYALPRTSEVEKAARVEAIQQALQAAAQVPLAVITEVCAVVALLPVLLEHGNRNLISDVGVAADFAQSALRCAWLNVEVNLALITDEQYQAAVRREMETSITTAEQTAETVWQETLTLVMGSSE